MRSDDSTWCLVNKAVKTRTSINWIRWLDESSDDDGDDEDEEEEEDKWGVEPNTIKFDKIFMMTMMHTLLTITTILKRHGCELIHIFLNDWRQYDTRRRFDLSTRISNLESQSRNLNLNLYLTRLI